MNENKKKIISVILALFTTICMNINLNKDLTFLQSFSGNDIFMIVIFILYCILFYKILDIKEKRLRICTSILAIIFAGFSVVGTSINMYLNLDGIVSSKIAFVKAILKFFGYSLTYYAILLFVYTKVFPVLKRKEDKKYRWFTNNKRSFFLVAIIIFIAYIPYFLTEYPGVFTADSVRELSDATYGMGNLINHHPVFHVFIISICSHIVKLFHGTETEVIALYSVLQMIATACTFSFMIYYMARKNVNIYLRIITFLLCAFYPPFAVYSVTMWKDIPFALSLVFFTICFIELATNSKNFFKSKFRITAMLISTILVILFRNNGIYVVLLTLPFMFFIIKEYRKQIAIFAVTVVAFYIMLKGPIFKLFNITDGPIKEMLSVPLQQIARTVRDNEESLTQEEKDLIYKFLPVDNLGQRYNPLISDSVKENLDNDAFQNNKMEFIKLWFNLLVKHPRSYVESFLVGSFGYWYPETTNWVTVNWDDYPILDYLDYKKDPIVELGVVKGLEEFANTRNIPVISMVLFSIGFNFWMILMITMYCIYKKQYRYMVTLVPIIILWLTNLASPVWCEYRYIYGMFTTMPIFLFLVTSLLNSETKFKERRKK